MSTKVALIVDDVPDLLEVVAEAIEMALPDHAVKTAESASAAEAVISALAENDQVLDLLIADQSLGGRTGLDLMAKTRESHDTALLLMTGRATANVEEQATRIGARIIWKPFRLTNLLETVREVMQR